MGKYSRDEPSAGRRGERAGPSSGGPNLAEESLAFPPLTPKWRSEGGGRGLNVSGKVERVPLQFGKGDGRMLQVVEQNLDLGGAQQGPLVIHSAAVSDLTMNLSDLMENKGQHFSLGLEN